MAVWVSHGYAVYLVLRKLRKKWCRSPFYEFFRYGDMQLRELAAELIVREIERLRYDIVKHIVVAHGRKLLE